ncbi:dirigent protein [Streptomyces sp. NPDC006339]|uniref:dirigent protein n=1 Tax=Streptomyces sp. NPDC006339 TaxID=3156755 RepID=UPI0033A4ED8A
MNRSFRKAGALGAAAVAAVTFAATAPAAAPALAHAADNGRNYDFTLYAKEVPDPGGEETGAPPQVGDVFAFAEDLYRSKGGEKVGRSGVSCAVVRGSGQQLDVHCVGTFVLSGDPAGQITGQTLTAVDMTEEQPASLDVAVTGGTGDFREARGYIRTSPDGDHDRLEFHVTTR